MGRYSRFYTKQALVGSKLSTADDFVYLAVLFKYGSMSKTALIQYNIQEKTTGVEVIKRLLKNGFISQSNHETDRRSKQVSISEKGQRELFSVFGKMDKVSQMIGGDLTQNEKILLLGLLKKLNDFHEFSFTSEKQLEFE
jgi:DNA-binding MarR family transcriptional regulator